MKQKTRLLEKSRENYVKVIEKNVKANTENNLV